MGGGVRMVRICSVAPLTDWDQSLIPTTNPRSDHAPDLKSLQLEEASFFHASAPSSLLRRCPPRSIRVMPPPLQLLIQIGHQFASAGRCIKDRRGAESAPIESGVASTVLARRRWSAAKLLAFKCIERSEQPEGRGYTCNRLIRLVTDDDATSVTWECTIPMRGQVAIRLPAESPLCWGDVA